MSGVQPPPTPALTPPASRDEVLAAVLAEDAIAERPHTLVDRPVQEGLLNEEPSLSWPKMVAVGTAREDTGVRQLISLNEQNTAMHSSAFVGPFFV